jgi:hypothetical protein
MGSEIEMVSTALVLFVSAVTSLLGVVQSLINVPFRSEDTHATYTDQEVEVRGWRGRSRRSPDRDDNGAPTLFESSMKPDAEVVKALRVSMQTGLQRVDAELDHVALIEVTLRPSTVMEPTKISNTKNTKPNDVTTSEPSKPVEVSTKTTDTKTTEAPAATASPKDTKSAKKEEARRILSVSLPEKLSRQLRLLCATTGTTTQAVVETALRRAVNKQLGAALEAIKSDLEG